MNSYPERQKNYEEHLAFELKSKKAQLRRYQSTLDHCRKLEEQRKKVRDEEKMGKSWSPLTPQQLFDMFKC